MDVMQLERGTKLTVYEEMQNRAVSNEYEAVLRYHESDKLLVLQCPWLYDNYNSLNLGARLNLSYGTDPDTFSFVGQAIERLRGNGLVMIKQLTDVKKSGRRQSNRDELRVAVAVYGLHKSRVSATEFTQPPTAPDINDMSFDISSGGICIISNTLLSSKHDPYYLVVFKLTEKDRFVLPSKLVRRSNYPHTKRGRYDYGFQFIYDNMPEEKSRLTRAILNRKIQLR